jgi:hypothetical protein
MPPHCIEILIAGVCICYLETVALLRGKNGTLLRLAMVILGALGGLSIAALLKLH